MTQTPKRAGEDARPYTRNEEPETRNAMTLKYKTCKQIRTNGTLCGSPALADDNLCYYHRRDRQRLTNFLQYSDTKRHYERPDAARDEDLSVELLQSLDLPALDDANAIQVTITNILRALALNLIDPRKASSMLYGLQIAVSNQPHVKLNLYPGLEPVAVRDPEPIESPIIMKPLTPEEREEFRRKTKEALELFVKEEEAYRAAASQARETPNGKQETTQQLVASG